jgi:site-specific DNA recombinase
MPAATPIRIAIYTRVSSDLQASSDEGSLETQERALRTFAEASYGTDSLIRVFREEGASGKNLDRPALSRMRAAIGRKEIDCVMVTRIDRLSRSLLDFCGLHDSFRALGVSFRSIKDSFDTSTAFGKAMLQILLVFAELERAQTSERTSTAMQTRAESGLWNGGYPPLGYDPDGKGGLRVVEGEVAIVQEAFGLFTKLQSTREVAKALNNRGYRTKRFKSRRKGMTGGGEFVQNSVSTMLKNRVYLGEVRNKGAWYPGRHVGVIDSVVFTRVQEAMKSNAKGAKNPRKRVQPLPYLLTGLIRCGSCSNEDGSRKSMTTWTTRGRGGKRYRYYRCTSLGKKPSPDCGVGNRNADALETFVLATVRRAVTEPSIVAEAVAEAERILREEINPARGRLNEMRGERDRLKRDGELFFDKAMDSGLADLDVAKKRLHEIQVRVRQLTGSILIEEASLALKETRHLDHETIHTALRSFDAVYEAMEYGERKEMLALLIERLTVYPDDRVTIALHDGEEVNGRLEHRRKTRRPASSGSGKGANITSAPQNREGLTAHDVERLAQRIDWLPILDHRQNLGDDLLGGR